MTPLLSLTLLWPGTSDGASKDRTAKISKNRTSQSAETQVKKGRTGRLRTVPQKRSAKGRKPGQAQSGEKLRPRDKKPGPTQSGELKRVRLPLLEKRTPRNCRWKRPDLMIGKIALYPYRRGWSCKREISRPELLRRKLRKILSHPRLKRAEVGVLVTDQRGNVIFSYNPRKKLIPASNVKLFTVAAALYYLGPHYRFVTKIYADNPIDSDGVVEGNIYIVGSGDPALRSEELWRIARDLYLQGLRKVTGRVYFDSSFFDRVHFGPGWDDILEDEKPEERFRPYLAHISGLSLNYNTIAIAVRPAKKAGEPAIIDLDPKNFYVKSIVNRTVTVPSGKFRVKIKIIPWRKFRDQIEIRGTVPLNAEPRIFWRRVTFPDWYTAFQFAESLRQQKIRVNLWPRRGSPPSEAVLLYQHYSPPLAQILRYTSKVSSNFTSEQVLKTIGAEIFNPPGSWNKGLLAIKKFLKKIDISQDEYRLLNGSGLSRANRLTPLAIVKLLLFMLRDFAVRPEFIAYQPVAGFDGTLRHRMVHSSASGVLRAKTGTIDGVSSLSGYIETPNHQLLVFSICMNGRKKRSYRLFRKIQDKIAQTLALFNPGGDNEPSLQRIVRKIPRNSLPRRNSRDSALGSRDHDAPQRRKTAGRTTGRSGKHHPQKTDRPQDRRTPPRTQR